jgi:hypothetical protein
MDPYMMLPDKCRCVDFQQLKLQELPEDVPHSEMPRHMLVYADRFASADKKFLMLASLDCHFHNFLMTFFDCPFLFADI